MFTLGGAMSGYCSIGRNRIEPAPASMITIEITHAKIGRSTKMRDSMAPSRLLGAGRVARREPTRACLAGLVHRHGLDGLPRLDLVRPLDDQAVSSGQAF